MNEIILIGAITVTMLTIGLIIGFKSLKRTFENEPHFKIKPKDSTEAHRFSIRDVFACKRFFKQNRGATFQVFVNGLPQLNYWHNSLYFYKYVKSKAYFDIVDRIERLEQQ
jgi:hypothetical protein